MEQPQPHIDEALIAKYLAGEASVEEEAAILEGARSSPEIRDMLAQLSLLWEGSRPPFTGKPLHFDVDRAWEKMETRIRPEAVDKAPKRISMLPRWVAGIAAALLLGTCFTFLYLYFSPQSASLTIQATGKNVIQTLPEGSYITLKEGSTLIYGTDFDEKKRFVQVQGVAFFEITRDEQKPFVVATGGLEVKVLGTSFYTQVASDGSAVEVGVQTGKVEVRVNQNGQKVYLTAGQRVIYSLQSQSFGPVAPMEVNRIYWKTGVLVFKDAPLSEVFSQLETSFDLPFKYNAEAFRTCRLTGRFVGNNVTEILDQLKLSFDLRYTVGTKVTIEGGGC